MVIKYINTYNNITQETMVIEFINIYNYITQYTTSLNCKKRYIFKAQVVKDGEAYKPGFRNHTSIMIHGYMDSISIDITIWKKMSDS